MRISRTQVQMRISRTQVQMRISRTQAQMRISRTQRRSGAIRGNLPHLSDEHLATESNQRQSEAIREQSGSHHVRQSVRQSGTTVESSGHLPDEHLATEPVLPTKVELTLAQLRQRRRPQVYR